MSDVDKALLAARWNCYREQRRILNDKALSGREKLSLIDAACAIHCAVYGDIEIYPPTHPLRLDREAMIKTLPTAIAKAVLKQKDKELGRVNMFDML